ncbi:MAG: HAMP domain-containing histidine kinase [Bacteriovorax sp.]|nr:HAMP domain-containing histidine kinase [Bacteriovorax sp.]
MKSSGLLKLVFIRTTAIFLSALFVILITFFVSDLSTMRLEVENKINNDVRSLQNIIRQYYLIGDLVSLKGYLDYWAKAEDIEGALVDSRGVVLWKYVTLKNHDKFLIKKYGIAFENGSEIGDFTIYKNMSIIRQKRLFSYLELILVVGFSTILFIFILNFVIKRTLNPLWTLRESLIKEASQLGFRLSDSKGNEVEDIKFWFFQISTEWYKERERSKMSAKAMALASLAKQVAHDIRSPLAALHMALETSLAGIPEIERLLVRQATQRINDIANDLLQKSKKESYEENFQHLPLENNKSIELIPVLVDILVSEKRMQYREFSGIAIEVELIESFGAFSLVDSKELKRVISNLVNNAVESFENHNGIIKIRVQKHNKHVEISVIDNGKGIPAHLIEKLGKEQLSFGKEASGKSGSGLGLYHAKQAIEQSGGTFEIISKEEVGTTIKLILSLASSPSWFTEKVDLTGKTVVVSIDDDLSVHQIWTNRLSHLGNGDFIHKQFHSGVMFSQFIDNNRDILGQMQFLIDFELLNQPMTGLDIIEEFNISKDSILVTSRYEEHSIQKRAEAIGLKILPKSLAGEVPIEVKKIGQKFDIILIDDDALVRMTWEMKAKQKGKTILVFESSTELWKKVSELDHENVFYIDVHLSENESGVDLSKELFKMGFKNLYLATGYESDNFQHVDWIKGVVGKNPVL